MEKLSKRNLVLVVIRTNETKTGGEGIGFNELVDRLKGRASRVTISKALDSLFDMGMLTSDWVLSNSKWKKAISTTNESRDIIDFMINDLKSRNLI